MKSKFALLASALGLFAVAPVWAGSNNFDFSSCASIVSTASQCPGDLGTAGAIFTDTTGTYAVLAVGVNGSFNPIDLFVKDDGGSENGLGLAGTLDNELNYSDAGQGIILDMAELEGDGMDSGTVTLGSLQAGESGTVCDFGIDSGPTYCQSVIQSGSTGYGSATVTWGESDPYLLFLPSQGQGNFLVSALTANSVPEPDSAALLAVGLAGLGLAIARRRRALAIR